MIRNKISFKYVVIYFPGAHKTQTPWPFHVKHKHLSLAICTTSRLPDEQPSPHWRHKPPNHGPRQKHAFSSNISLALANWDEVITLRLPKAHKMHTPLPFQVKHKHLSLVISWISRLPETQPLLHCMHKPYITKQNTY